MSIHAMSWAWTQNPGSSGAKLVLLALADTANDDGTCWPGQKRIAEKVCLSERAVRDSIAKLVEIGLLRVEERRRADGTKTSNLYVLAIADQRKSASSSPGEAGFRHQRKPTSGHEPSVEPSGASAPSSPRTQRARTGARGGTVDQTKPPDDFPTHLAGALSQVVAVLQRVADAKGAQPVTVLAVARAMASYPQRPHLRAAEGLEHWLVFGTGQRTRAKDVVGFFRNQLELRWTDETPGHPGGQPVGQRPTTTAALMEAYERVNGPAA
jgi:hypothetical protein